jgi:hypothetical protein
MGVEVGEQRLRALRLADVKADLNPGAERTLEGQDVRRARPRLVFGPSRNGCSGGSEALKPSDLRPVLTGGPVGSQRQESRGLERGADHRGGGKP